LKINGPGCCLVRSFRVSLGIDNLKHTNMTRFKITGTDRSGKRFKIETDLAQFALGINAYRGSLWENIDGTYKLVRRYYN